MPTIKLTTQKEHQIALEALYHDVKGTSLKPVAEKHGISVKKVEELLGRGMKGFRSAFYGSNGESGNGVKSFLARYGVAASGHGQGTPTESLAAIKTEDESLKVDGLLTPELAIETLREYNELALAFNDDLEDGEAPKKLVALTAGKLRDFTGMSQTQVKRWMDEHKKEVTDFNESFELTPDSNKQLKGFDFWREYNHLKEVVEA